MRPAFIGFRKFGATTLPVFMILPEGSDSLARPALGARDTDPIRAPALSRRVG
jgi:hypothetical protein